MVFFVAHEQLNTGIAAFLAVVDVFLHRRETGESTRFSTEPRHQHLVCEKAKQEQHVSMLA